MKQNPFTYFLVITFIMLATACHKSNTKPGMVDFDQVFIPVFCYVYIGEKESASRAMKVLDRKWQQLKPSLLSSNHSTNRQETFANIDAWLEEADCAIGDSDLSLARIQLDHARYEWIDFRRRESIPYFLDKVWDLESAIDIIVQISEESLVGLEAWDEFTIKSKEIEAAWYEVLNTNYEEQLFGIDNLDKMLLEKRTSELGSAIEHFLNACKGSDICEVENNAQQMEVAYLNYLCLFGDFESSKSHFALSRDYIISSGF